MSTAPSPRNLRAALSDAELRALYVDQKLTIEQIATRFGLGPTTISRRFADLGIPARRRGTVPGKRYGSEGQPCRWSAELAYAVGLIATDGNLSPKRGALSITSNDVDLLEAVRSRLDLRARIRPHPGGYGHRCHRLDGDGSIVTYVDRYNTFKSPAYVYTRLFVSIVTASRRFAEWLQTAIRRLRGASGSLAVRRSAGKRDIFCLKYAKGESLSILRWMYYRPGVLCLERKRVIAIPFLRSPEPSRRRGPGRPMVI
jgi:AraC-like DNA-binding protein